MDLRSRRSRWSRPAGSYATYNFPNVARAAGRRMAASIGAHDANLWDVQQEGAAQPRRHESFFQVSRKSEKRSKKRTNESRRRKYRNAWRLPEKIMPVKITHELVGIRIEEVRRHFDKKGMLRAIRIGNNRALAKVGAFIRSDMRRSIRRRKRKSTNAPPGHPPFHHTDPGLKFILFIVNARRQTVKIGPVIYAGVRGTTPGVLEKGGTTTISVRERGSRDARTRRIVTIESRPFAKPALDKNIQHIPRQWDGVIR